MLFPQWSFDLVRKLARLDTIFCQVVLQPRCHHFIQCFGYNCDVGNWPESFQNLFVQGHLLQHRHACLKLPAHSFLTRTYTQLRCVIIGMISSRHSFSNQVGNAYNRSSEPTCNLIGRQCTDFRTSSTVAHTCIYNVYRHLILFKACFGTLQYSR